MKTYVNISDYTMQKFGTKDYDTDHTLKYRSIVKDLDYESCKNILLRFTTLERLKNTYKNDEHFNEKIFNSRNQLDIWDTIGELMATNPNRKIILKSCSLCNFTCIAKQCARMIIMEDI